MKKFLLSITALILLVGCISPPIKRYKPIPITRPVPKKVIVIKKPQVQKDNYYLGGNCWSNTTTLNCKLKKAHTLTDKLLRSLEGLDGAIGGCCANGY